MATQASGHVLRRTVLHRLNEAEWNETKRNGTKHSTLAMHPYEEVTICRTNKKYKYEIAQQSAQLEKHYANTPMQYTAIFHGCKNDNF